MPLPVPLTVVADDFGIGPETTRGILDAARGGVLTATVLLVNTPYAAAAVDHWRRAGRPVEVGWHPCLTLDRPLMPAGQVPSLVDPDGRFWPLGKFLRRALLGRVRAAEVAAEFRAQLVRFRELVGHSPRVVNSHQHVALFGPVRRVLLGVLRDGRERPYVRRVGESVATLRRVPGARVKRLVLTALGRRQARRAAALGFPGCPTTVGVTDPPCLADDRFFERWLRAAAGRPAELACHPGHYDPTLIGRDCPAGPGVTRRVQELRMLLDPRFPADCRAAGFRVARPEELVHPEAGRRVA
jgi:predicted glycoside hydrolase/deacetylase ChbG (UPF0249 family)